MIKEIGGEFFKTPKLNLKKEGIFDLLNNYNYQLFESGREAFEIINKLSSKKILFPSYACDSMFQFLNKKNIVFYNVDLNFNIDIEDIKNKLTDEIGILIYMNYFGRIQNNNVLEYINSLKENNILIIEDTTHSFFSNVCSVGDYCIASLRKWFCISNGGILYSKKKFQELRTNENIYFTLKRERAFHLKEKYLFKKKVSNKYFLKLFNECEENLDNNSQINSISKSSFEILKKVDVDYLVKRRKKNYKYLYKKLKKISKIKIYKIDIKKEVPLFLVIKLYEKERNLFHRYLIKNKIYCPIHWPLINELDENFEVKDFIKDIVSIPIDQRYSRKDMNYIYKKILKFFRENG